MGEYIINGSGVQYPMVVNSDGSINTTSVGLGSVTCYQKSVPWIIGGSGGYFYNDKSTKAMPSIDYAHHEVHDGNHYNVRGFTSGLGSGAGLIWCVTTPNTTKWAHMTFQIEGTTQTEVYVYEGVSCSGGTAITPRNNNRNAGDNSSLILMQNPVISGANAVAASGVLIEKYSKGLEGTTPSKSSFNGEVTREDEMILKSGTTYLYYIKSVGAGNIIDFAGTWYEHTDRENQF